jgi:hypothetical protein
MVVSWMIYQLETVSFHCHCHVDLPKGTIPIIHNILTMDDGKLPMLVEALSR